MSERGPDGAALRGRPRTAPPARRWWKSSGQLEALLCSRNARCDEVDGVADCLDPGRLFLAHPDLVSILELHDQLIEVERVGVEVLTEPRVGLDPIRRHLELVAEVIPHELHDLVALHRGHYCVSAVGSRRSASRVAPEAASSSRVRSTARSSTARCESRTAFAMPSGVELPWATTATPRRPSRIAPPTAFGSMAERRPPRAGRRSRPPAAASGPERAAPRTASATALAVPSSVFRVTFPVKPSVTTTSASPLSRSRPSTLPMKRMASVSASASWASTTSARPFFCSSPTESSATRGLSTPRTAALKADPRKANWIRCW